ncbi:MAG: hypothetical protein EBQ71_16690, partial [Betaproteobacteria bacterium]|nr:hypothetical protein [Betaproteobacteria bacterium]
PLADRILDAFPSGSYALSALLRLMDIVESTSVPTAAVECRAQPRLLINPEFVAVHAHTPEKLLMLVMHELHHVLLGHTTLFPRLTLAQNFVFDAVINGIVCRMFPGADHTSFFTDYYDQASFPHCLLRPPPDWPGKRGIEGRDHGWADPGGMGTAAGILALREPLRSLAKELHEALYSAAGAATRRCLMRYPSCSSTQHLVGFRCWAAMVARRCRMGDLSTTHRFCLRWCATSSSSGRSRQTRFADARSPMCCTRPTSSPGANRRTGRCCAG